MFDAFDCPGRAGTPSVVYCQCQLVARLGRFSPWDSGGSGMGVSNRDSSHTPSRHGGAVLHDGDFVIVPPEDAHRPNCQAAGPCLVRKIVVKVKV